MSSARLSRDDVVAAGVALTAEHGLRSLTLKSVSERLGVRAPSLYHHLPGGVDELLVRVATRVQEVLLAQVEPALPDDATLWDRLEQPLRQVSRVSALYPGVLEYLLTTGRDGPSTLAGADATLRVLLDSELAGLAPEAFVVIHAFVTGWVFAQRPSSEAARAAGHLELADVLLAAAALDQDQVLLDGLRALVRGLQLEP